VFNHSYRAVSHIERQMLLKLHDECKRITFMSALFICIDTHKCAHHHFSLSLTAIVTIIFHFHHHWPITVVSMIYNKLLTHWISPIYSFFKPSKHTPYSLISTLIHVLALFLMPRTHCTPMYALSLIFYAVIMLVHITHKHSDFWLMHIDSQIKHRRATFS